MLDGVAQKAQMFDSKGRIVNPTGTLYITAGSASGSKYYDLKAGLESYAAVRLQLNTPSRMLPIFVGVGNNQFLPDSSITRQDMFTLLYKHLILWVNYHPAQRI